MTRVIADITVSLDGFVTGPDAGPGNGLGIGGKPLHQWVFSGDPGDQRILEAATARSGAVVMGRRLFDVIDAPDGWSDELGYGATEVGTPPFFVVTSTAPEHVRLTGLDWTFATTGLADAITAARESAEAQSAAKGADLDVVVMGGGALVASAVASGLVDTLILHLSPVILGAGTPLFVDAPRRTLTQREVVVTPNATHLTYDVD
ncbi:DNA-binding protein [Leifsonia sp. Leaf336]|uniref:dihydrofolate reductase family protein n=1 Tax=Leifsonia sp. Leaf336 TaxID=1736341 RepID=UPI0006F7A228|nr:dihydrofolate reductase family protein [Leifsonia sp. Leaf336]KQR50686.1 DNA-binding protein [Leifsonia sp. Leaf336]